MVDDVIAKYSRLFKVKTFVNGPREKVGCSLCIERRGQVYKGSTAIKRGSECQRDVVRLDVLGSA